MENLEVWTDYEGQSNRKLSDEKANPMRSRSNVLLAGGGQWNFFGTS